MADNEVAHLEKAHEVVIAGLSLAGTSTQKPDDTDPVTPDFAIEPPLSLDALAKLSQISSTRSSIIDALARNTVGLGFTIEVASGHEKEVADPREEEDEVTNILEALASRDTRMDAPSFTEMMVAVKTDEEEVGWGFLEVSRSKLTGRIDGLFHVPGKHMRRRRERDGYVLLNPLDQHKNTDFYNFGEKVEYEDDGEPTPKLQKGKGWGRNEVICFKLYTSESRDYGLPRDVALALEYAGDKLAAEYNVSFFDAGGTPPTVLFVHSEADEQGARVSFKVPQATVQRISNTIKSDTGHRDRVAIIPLPPNSRVDHVKLGEVSERDMGFIKYRLDNTARMLSAFRMQPIFIGLQGEGRYDAEVQRAITLEQLFDPEQDRYEARLRYTVMKDLGYSHLNLKFKRMAVESDSARRESASRLAEAAAITLREYRAAHGWGPLPEAAEGEKPEPGQYPAGINDRLVNTGVPRGAENRNTESDQRGLRPDVGERTQRSTDNELEIQREKQKERPVITVRS